MKKAFIFIIFSFLFQTSFVSAFEVQNFDGETVSLDDKIGQGNWSLVMFWAHDCGICRSEFPLFSEFHNKREDVDVIGISIDGAEKKHLAQSFLDASKPSFESYLSDLTLVGLNYHAITEEGFRGTPTYLLFTPKGELIGNMPGKLYITALEDFIERNPQ